jgi:hypothetical protein
MNHDMFRKAIDACVEYRKQLDEKTAEVARLREENLKLQDIANRACNLLNLKGGYQESYELRNEIKTLKNKCELSRKVK